MIMKKCIKCETPKELINFNKDNRAKDGHRSECNSCRQEYNTNFYKKNSEIIKQRVNNYRKYNSEKIMETKNRYYTNPINKFNKLVNDKKYRDNIDVRVKTKEYRNNNAEQLRANRRVYKKIKLQDPLYKLTHTIGVVIRSSFKKHGYTKKSRTYGIVGCSFEFLKQHIEGKFKSWMNWQNHGKYNGDFEFGWDIDHIIPLSSAKTEEELLKLCHYTNLQPLCSHINRDIKRDKSV